MTDCTTNFLSPTGFRVSVNRKYTPKLEMLAQTVQHPATNIDFVEIPYRRAGISTAGAKMSFGEVTFDVIMDEKMLAYQEMFDWMKFLVENESKLSQDRASYSEIQLFILNSSNNSNRSIIYHNAHPSLLGDIQFASTSGEVQYLTFPVSFQFDYWELK